MCIRWTKQLMSTVAPALVLALLMAAGLHLLDSLPPLLQSPPIQTFQSIEEAQREAGAEISIPSYFPDYFSWPPSTVQVRRQPDIVVYMAFQARDSGTEALWITEILSDDVSVREFVSPPPVITQTKSIPLKDIRGTLVVGFDQTGKAVYELDWSDSGRQYVVSTTHSLEEIIRISESMVHP